MKTTKNPGTTTRVTLPNGTFVELPQESPSSGKTSGRDHVAAEMIASMIRALVSGSHGIYVSTSISPIDENGVRGDGIIVEISATKLKGSKKPAGKK